MTGPNALALVELILLIGLFCYRPIAGLVAILSLILGLPGFFGQFGLAVSAGARYMPNIFLVLMFAALWMAVRALRLARWSTLDRALVLYLLIATATTIVVAGRQVNPGVWIKQFATYPLFYFSGRLIGTFGSKEYHSALRTLYVFLWLLASYLIVSVALELYGITLQAEVLDWFARIAQTQVVRDPFLTLREHGTQSFYRVLGPQIESTQAAATGLVCLVPLAAVPTGKSKTWEITRYALVALLAITIFLTGTRAVMIAALPPLAVIVWLRRDKERGARGFAAALCVAGLLIAAAGPTGALEEITRNAKTSAFYDERVADASTVEVRLDAFGRAWDKVGRSTWFGSGIGTEMGVFEDAASMYTAHSYYLDVLAWQGLPLGLWYFVLCGVFLRRSWRIARRSSDRELAAAARVHAALAVCGATAYLANPEQPALAVMLWLGAGLLGRDESDAVWPNPAITMRPKPARLSLNSDVARSTSVPRACRKPLARLRSATVCRRPRPLLPS